MPHLNWTLKSSSMSSSSQLSSQRLSIPVLLPPFAPAAPSGPLLLPLIEVLTCESEASASSQSAGMRLSHFQLACTTTVPSQEG